MSGTNGQLTRSNQSAAGNQFFGRKFGLAPSTGVFDPGSPFPVSVARISKVSSVGITQLFSTTWNITAPVGVAAGHLLISVMVHNTASAVTLPSGWTLLFNVDYGGPRRVTIAYKVATASEPAPARDSYTFTLGAAGDGAHIIAAYRGVNETTPIDVSASATAAATVDITLPSITTTVNNAMLLWVASDNNGNTLGVPAGTKVVSEMFNSVAFSRIWLAEEFDATSGATGTRVATTGGASVNWAAASIALAPVSTGRIASLAVTESRDTLAASASASVNLTAAITEAPDTVASSASVALNLTLAKTESADTLASTASTSVNLSAAITESPDTVASTASASINLTLAKTEAADTVSSSASASVNITVAITEAPDTLAADATTAQPTRTISLAVTESPDTVASTASVSTNLALAKTESPDTLVATASASLNLTLAATESPDTLASTASVSTNLSAAITESPDTLSASVSVALNLSLSVVESPDTLVSSVSVSGLAERVLTFAGTESPDTLAASASVGALPTRTIDAILIELPDTLAASASVSVGAALSATEQGDTLASSASVSALAERLLTLSIVESPDKLNASAIVSAFDTRILTLAITEAPDTLAASALTVTIPFTSVHAAITQRGVGSSVVARQALPAIIQRVPSVGVVRAGAQGRITQSDIRIAITQEP